MTSPPYSLIPAFRTIAKSLARASDAVIERYRADRIADEEDITAALTQEIESTVCSPTRRRGRASKGSVVSWKAKVLRTGKAKAAEERRHGADLLAVTEINYNGTTVSKGFLGQAKRIEPGTCLSGSEWERLQAQAKLMLDLTPAAFVLVYSRHYGVQFVSALTVSRVDRRDLFELSAQPIQHFFEWHLGCFIGDSSLDEPHIRTLDDLRSSPKLRDLPIANVIRLELNFEGS